MSWLDQPRTLEIACAALPKWQDECLFTVSRLTGTEKLGKLYDYTVEIATKEDSGLTVQEARDMIKVDELVGGQVTVNITTEGSGTCETGNIGVTPSVNVGAEVREITGLIVAAQCVGADIRLFAARGRVEIQAQRDAIALAALKDLTISSRTNGKITVTAATEVWLGAAGSYIQINGSGIINGSPGPILEKGEKWSKSGADSMRMPLPGMPIPEDEQAFSNRLDLSEAGQVVADLPHPWANLPYVVTDHTGNILTSGTLDEAGSTSRIFARQAQDADAWIGTSGWDATEESLSNDGSEEMPA